MAKASPPPVQARSPKVARKPSVWSGRIGMGIIVLLAALFSGVLLIPGANDFFAPVLGAANNAYPLAMGGIVLAVLTLVGLIIGWGNPFVPPALPSVQRVTTLLSDKGGLKASAILQKEFDYAAKATEQAMEHRMTIVNFYLLVAGAAGSGVVALISSQAVIAVAAAPLLWVVALIGGLFLLQLIALRRAWADSVIEMNYVKEFFVTNSNRFDHDALQNAFHWKAETIPATNRHGNVFHYSAILIAVIDAGAFFGGIFALGLTSHASITSPGSFAAATVLTLFFLQAHLWLFDIMLIPTGPNATAPKATSAPAQASAAPNTVLGSRPIFTGQLLSLRVDDIRLPSGKTDVREVIQKAPAIVVVPYLAATDEILFVEQYRDAVGATLLELPAGLVDPHEDHAVTARRELREETGYEADTLRYLGHFFTSPGFTDEQLHLYLATDLRRVADVLDPDEIQRWRAIPRADVMQMITQGTLVDGKSILGVLRAERALPTQV
jgi:ADP-ribose pyrophosphatase